LRKWTDLVSTSIKDTTKGILNVDGKKIKNKLGPHVLSRTKFTTDYLYQKMKKKADQTSNDLSLYKEALGKTPIALSEYAKFLEIYNEAKERISILEVDKNEIETMHGMIRRADSSVIKGMDAV
jgi:dynein heavy chain